MRSNFRVIVIAGLAILGIATVGSRQQISATRAATSWRASRSLADGGLPMPPWPKTGNVLVADGGLPMPPWPPSRNLLKNSGGAGSRTVALCSLIS